MFSGDSTHDGKRVSVSRFTRGIGRIVAAEGLSLNTTRMRTSAQSQQVLGVVVNARSTVARQQYDRLRAILHNCVRTSGPAQNRDGHSDFRAYLAGQIGWVASIDPARGAKLHSLQADRLDVKAVVAEHVPRYTG